MGEDGFELGITVDRTADVAQQVAPFDGDAGFSAAVGQLLLDDKGEVSTAE
ncbi:MAG: hypothetical protein RBS99_06985 [Rhodospirillales bacterium]|nr:hypothetical protein [Rhodospirillales bacterium]